MAKDQALGLITEMHERFADDSISQEQQALMASLQQHVHELDEATPVDPSLVDSVELLVSELEAEHPLGASVLRQLAEVLKNIGV